MCTIIKKTQFNRPKIAKKDITVYKCGNISYNGHNFISNCEGFLYIPEVLNEEQFTYDDDNSVSDEIEMDYLRTGIPVKYVIEGFHSFKSVQRMRDGGNDSETDAKFIIPKGAKYYENECGNLVSNQIIFKKFI